MFQDTGTLGKPAGSDDAGGTQADSIPRSYPDDSYVTSAVPSSTTGTGTLLEVIEYADGTIADRLARANQSSVFYPQTFEIPVSWSASQVTAIASEIHHLRNWITNSEFNAITGWYQSENDPPSVVTESYDSVNDWVTITRVSGGKVKYDYWGSWNQTVNVYEGGAVSAQLNVTFRITTTTGSNGQNARPYIFVNGTIYELPTGGNRFSVNQDWTTYSIELPIERYIFPGILEVAVGIEGFINTQFQTTGVLYCDDILLSMKTSRLSEAVDLRVRDKYNPTTVVPFITGPDGKGYATMNNQWDEAILLESLSNESNVEFTCNLNMPITRETSLLSNTYTVASGEDASWASEFTAREMAFPFTYRHFNVTIPEDWTVDAVYDAYGDPQLIGTNYYNASFYPLSSTLECDVQGTGVSGTPHYGTWTIEATSPNYAESIMFIGDTGGAWVQKSVYYPYSDMRAIVLFLDQLGSPPVSSGTGTITFYDIEENAVFSEGGGSLDLAGSHTYQNGTGLANITISPSWLAGPVTAVSVWSNGTSVGRIDQQFFIYHRTTLEAESATYTAFRGDSVSVRVRFVDTETLAGIAGALVTYSWAYTTGAMTYAGNGWYVAAVDTSMAVIGSYPVTTNATKEYFDQVSMTDVSIEIQEKTTLYSPRESGTPTTDYEIAWGTSRVVYLAYEDSIAMNPASMAASPGSPAVPDPSGAYTSNNLYTVITSDGNAMSLVIETDIDSYNVVAEDLSGLAFKVEGRFSIAVTGSVSAYNFSGSAWVTIISSYSPLQDTTLSWNTQHPSDLVSPTGQILARVYATAASSFTFSLDLFDFVAFRPIDDGVAGVSVLTNWPAQTIVGAQIGPVYNATLGVWQVTLDATSVTPSEYVILVEASATGHQEKSLELTIVVRGHHTKTTVMPPQETPWSWKTQLNLTFSDQDAPSVVISEANITSIAVETPYGIQTFTSGTWSYSVVGGVATIRLTIDTSLWDVGRYSVSITAITSGTGASKYFDDGTASLEIVIREHDVRITVDRPSATPWGWKTSVSFTLFDLDNLTYLDASNLTSVTIAGQVFTSWQYSAGTCTCHVDTSAWSISEGVYDVSVVMRSGPRWYTDTSSQVTISVRAHGLQVFVIAPAPIPWGTNVQLVIEIIDSDNSTVPVPQNNLTSIVIGSQTFTSSNWTYENKVYYSQLTIILLTDDWPISQQTELGITLSTSGSGPSKFYFGTSSSVDITIRRHSLALTVLPPSSSSWGNNTIITINIIDLDNLGFIVPESNLTSLTIGMQTFTAANWIYSVGTYATLTVTYVTSSLPIGTYNGIVVGLTTTGVGASKFFTDATSSVSVSIRAHIVTAYVLPLPATPWGQATNITIEISDQDHTESYIPPGEILFISVSGSVYTSGMFSYASGVAVVLLDTSAYAIGLWPLMIQVVFAGSPKNYTDCSASLTLRIASHSIVVEALNPAATPWSEDTVLIIRIHDISVTSNVLSSDNVTQIVVNGIVITSWTYDNGNFSIVVATSSWNVGLYKSLAVTVVTANSVAKFYSDGSTVVAIEIRNRYTEAYSPSVSPVPYPDNLTFTITFRDRDNDGALVDFTTLYLNGTELVQDVHFWITRMGEGTYEVVVLTTGLGVGSHVLIATCSRVGFANATTNVQFTLRSADTSALASGYNFNVPLGTTVSLAIQFMDLDRDVNVINALVSCNWTSYSVSDANGDGVYDVVLVTTDSTALGTYYIEFTLSKTNYKTAILTVTIRVKTHATYLSFDEAVVSTGIGANITAALFYEDIDLGVGISNDTGQVRIYLYSADNASAILYVTENTALGEGHYLVLIPANQFGGIGMKSLVLYFNWTGSARYLNLTRSFVGEIRGTDSDLRVSVSPQAVYYGDLINFTVLYTNAENGDGIANQTGNVWGMALLTTPGESILPSDFSIIEIDAITSPGQYRVTLDSSLITSFGAFTIRIWMNWSAGIIPLFENRTIQITVTVLIRVTLLDITPPQNTAYDELANFSFSYYDVSTNTPIENSTYLTVVVQNPGLVYSAYYNSGTRAWTISVDTSSLASIGTHYLMLVVSWSGAPFYQNQTKAITLVVTRRPSQLTYTPPTPTFFISNVSITFTYIDLIEDSSLGLSGCSLSLSSPGLTLAGYYSVIDNGDGTYSVELNSTAFLEPGAYPITATIGYIGSRYTSDASVTFSFRVLYRSMMTSVEPIGSTAWLTNVIVTLHITDGETADAVYNDTGAVGIAVASVNASSPGLAGLDSVWYAGTDTYTLSLANTLTVGSHVVFFNASYSYSSPYYGYRIFSVIIVIRQHSTELQLDDAPERVGYGLNTTFRLYYEDLDLGTPISGGVLYVDNASLSGFWTIYDTGLGYYSVEIDTNALPVFGTYWVSVRTQNTGGLANYQDSSIYVKIYVRERYTQLTYDPIASTGYTGNVIIVVYYTDSDTGNTGIDNSTYSGALSLLANATTYSVTNGATPGSYVIEIPAFQFTPFILTPLQIQMTFSGAPFFQNRTVIVNFQVRGTTTEFAWDPSDPTPYGNLMNVTIYWGDMDSGTPVLAGLGVNASAAISCTTQPSLDTLNPAVVSFVQISSTGTHARFVMTLNTSFLDGLGTYLFTITLDWTNPLLAPYYEDQVGRLISVVIRARNTAVPQISAAPVPYGDLITVMLQYVDLDADLTLITGGSLEISVLDGASYTVNYVPNSQQMYEVYITTQGTSLLGNTRFNLTVAWYGAPFYRNQTSVYVYVSINMRIASIDLQYPAAVPYLDNVSFIITLRDTHSLEWMDNNATYIYAEFISPLGATGAVTIFSIGGGQYRIEFNSTEVGSIGQYTLRIIFNHTSSAPYYAQVVRDVTSQVYSRTTSLDYEPITAVPYGNIMSFNLTYTDIDSMRPIDSASVLLSCGTSAQPLVIGENYWVTSIGSGMYTVEIETEALGTPMSYTISVLVNSTTEWWLTERTKSIVARVAYRQVEMSTTTPESVYYDDVALFEVLLTDIDNDTGMTGMAGLISVVFITPTGADNSSVSIVDMGNGVYSISFDTNILDDLSPYSVTVSFTWGASPFYWSSVLKTVTGRVYARPTQLTYDVEGSTPYQENVSILLYFDDMSTDTGIEGAVITAICGTSAQPLTPDANYWVTQQSSGVYLLLVDSQALGDIGYFSIGLDIRSLGEPFYVNRTKTVIVEVRERATRLTYTPPIQTPFGNTAAISLRYQDVDAGLVGIGGASSFFTLVSVNGSAVDSTYYTVVQSPTVTGLYVLYLNSSKLETFGFYLLNVTVSGMTSSHYQSQQAIIECDIRARYTQLTTSPIAQTPYTANASITLYFVDKDSNQPITNSTGGVLATLNRSISWWIQEQTPGTYSMRINVTELGSDGSFDFEVSFYWVNGRPFYENRTLTFTVSVIGSVAVLSYTPPQQVCIGDDIVFTVTYRDSATGNGISNSSGNIRVTMITLNMTPVGTFQYSLTTPSAGVFIFTVNSTPFADIGPVFFEIDITWTVGVLPYYPDINGTLIRAVIREVYTQIIAEAPDPGTIPRGDNFTLLIGYYDLDHEAYVEDSLVDTDWLGTWTFSQLPDGRLMMTFETDSGTALGKITFNVSFSKTFYLGKAASVTISVRLVSTLASATPPDPSVIPVGDITTVEITFIDIDHTIGVSGATIASDWAYGWSYIESEGVFTVTIQTAGVTNLIKYSVVFTLSRDGHQTSYVTVRFEVRQIRTAITVDIPSSIVAGNNATITVTFEDLDHGTGITDATILTTALPGTYSWSSVGGGVYVIEFFLWQEDYGTYSYDVTAVRSSYASASVNIDLDVRQIRTTLTSPLTIALVDWGDVFMLEASYYQDDIPVGPVSGAAVTATFGSNPLTLVFNGTVYMCPVDTSLVGAGTYIITINAQKSNCETRILQVTVVVAVIETAFASVSGSYSYSVVSGQDVTIMVYYEAVLHATGIVGANVTYEWDYGTGNLASNGTAGFYTAVITTSGADINLYTLYVRASRPNHAEASIYFSVDVRLVDTELDPLGPGAVEAVFGALVNVQVRYHSPTMVQNVTGALVTFRFAEADYRGTLDEISPGIYSVDINTTALTAGSFTVYITATLSGYESATLVYRIQVARVDTQLSALTLSVIMVYEQSVLLYFNYSDIINSQHIENATLEYRWQGGTGLLTEVGSGIYMGQFDSRTVGPGLYYLYVTASKTNYKQAVTSVPIEIQHIQTEVLVAPTFQIPVGDSYLVVIYLNDTSYNRPVLDAVGSAIWALGTSPLESLGNGSYVFTVPNTLNIASYPVTLILGKMNHTTSSQQITVVIRQIATQLVPLSGSPYISTTVGSLVTFSVVYTDIDHNVPITGATLSVTQIQQLIGEDDYTVTLGSAPGEYLIQFTAPVDYEFNVIVYASSGSNYQARDLTIVIVSVPVAVDPFMLLVYFGGSFGIIIALVAALVYVKVLSVPKRVREMNKMIKALSKGRIPQAPTVTGRREAIAQMVNEDLEPLKIQKPIGEFAAATIEYHIPEIESLLAELAELTHLTEKDVEVFRKDLMAMKPSERPGFLNEVIKQERARRAQEVAEKAEKPEAFEKITPEELEVVRQKLLKMGIKPEDVDLMLENAKELSKSEIEALVDNIDDTFE